MTIPRKNRYSKCLTAMLLVLVALALAAAAAPATAQAPLSPSLGSSDPTVPLALTPAQKSAILDAVRHDNAKPSPKMPPNSPVSVGIQLPASIALRMLPDSALAQAPAAKTLQYTVIENQVVLVDPTNMRVVEIINQ